MRWKGSVSVTAMVAMAVILIISLALVNFTFFMAQNSQWDYEKSKAGWFLEGRVQEYFDGLMSGSIQLKEGRQDFLEKIEGKDQSCFFNTIKNENGGYVLKAGMLWKNRYPAGRTVEFRELNPYGYAIYFNGNAAWRSGQKSAVMGGIGVRGDLSLSAPGSFYFHHSRSYPYRLDYGNSASLSGMRYFTNDLNAASFLFGDSLVLNGPSALSGSKTLRKNADLKDTDLPVFKNIWDGCYPYRDAAWFIDSRQFFDTVTIVNPKSPVKELVSYGNGYTTSFRINDRSTFHVYIMEGRTGASRVTMDPALQAYSLGGQENRLFLAGQGRLELNASASPVRVELPDDAFNELGTIALSGPGWSVCSSDEKIDSIYFHEVSPYRRLSAGSDYSYDRRQKKVVMKTESFYRNEVFVIGKGNGRTTLFQIRGFDLDTSQRYYFYSGGRRIVSYAVSGNQVSLPRAPENGKEIVCLRVPKIFLKKSPPGPGEGVYIDINDRAAILDLGKIQNYPKNGVILSTVPLLIKGSSRFPLVILSTGNIYLDNVNMDGKGAPVYTASGTGVFIYQEKDEPVSVQNRCVVYTPLKSLEAVQEGSETAGPFRIRGSVVFGYEKDSTASDTDWGNREFVYDDSIGEYFSRPPFLYVPKPFTILKMVRN